MSGMYYVLASILCLAVGGSMAQVLEGNYNVTAFCTTVKPGTQLGSIVSCDYYYVCTQNGPVKTNCQSGYAYNFKAQSCAPSSQVQCYYGLANPCQEKTEPGWVPVVGTCSEYIYCDKSVAKGQGSCGSLIFNATSQRCSYGDCDINADTVGPNLVSPCEVIPPNVYFGSTSECREYSVCYSNGKVASGMCPNSAYVVQGGYCGYDVGDNCARIVKNPVPNTCTTVGDTMPNSEVCGNYLFCNGETFVPKSCPYGQYYDTVEKTCVARQQAVAAAGCNRCQYSTRPFVNAAASKYCMDYYYCNNNGKHDPETTCPNGYFFDEPAQGCAANAGLPTYTISSGACKTATIQPSGTTTADPSTDTSGPTTPRPSDTTETTDGSPTTEQSTPESTPKESTPEGSTPESTPTESTPTESTTEETTKEVSK